MRVLYVPLEFLTWQRAQYWSYPVGLGLEEGFKAAGIECFTLPALCLTSYYSPETWLDHARWLCHNRQFDLVWLTVPHARYDRRLLRWLAELAPVRVGYFVESMDPFWGARQPGFSQRKRRWAQASLPYLTHAVVWDEADVASLEQRGIPALWWPGHVPAQFIHTARPANVNPAALFFGAVYGERARYLDHPILSKLLVRPSHSLEHDTRYPQLFDELNGEIRQRLALSHRWDLHLLRSRLERKIWWWLRHPFRTTEEAHRRGGPQRLGTPQQGADSVLLESYLDQLRLCRRKCFQLWLDTLAQGLAIVNLPQSGSGRSGRVFEAMAVGRPVLVHRAPNRPQADELFEPGREILMFESPEELAGQIRLLQRDPDRCQQLAGQARQKLLQFHTTEHRVHQFVQWMTTGEGKAPASKRTEVVWDNSLRT